MGELSQITKQFLEQVKGATIAQLIEADKAVRWDHTLSAAEIQKAFAQGTLTQKIAKDGTITSSAYSISKEQADTIVREIAEKYPAFVTDNKYINFRPLKGELDPEYKRLNSIPKDQVGKGSGDLQEYLKNMDATIRQAEKEERAQRGK